MDTQRYKAIGESLGGHQCCFSATVVDSQDVTEFDPHGVTVCECYDLETAQKIADALNKEEER